MSAMKISESISYIAAVENPLSADIGIVRDGETVWLYDVGSIPVGELDGSYRVVLSHFHQDHTGNIGGIGKDGLYLSRETYRHVKAGTVIDRDVCIGRIHLFPIPSSHCKGCIGMEIDGTYAFVGDALYGRNGVYNAQLLQAEIEVLTKLSAPYLLISHYPGMIRQKSDVISELKHIYALRQKNSPDIAVGNL